MLSHTLTRLVAVLLTVVAVGVTSDIVWFSIVWSAAFAHYLLALFYSKKKIHDLVRRGYRVLLWSGLTMLAGAALYFGQFSLLLYFGVHHVFNEVYLVNKRLSLHDKALRGRFIRSGLILNSMIYVVLMRNYQEFDWVPDEVFFSLLTISVLYFIYSVRSLIGILQHGDVIDAIAFEVIGLLLVLLSLYVDIRLNYVVLYHFVFWYIYPVSSFKRQGHGVVLTYIVLSTAMLIMFLVLSPIGPFDRATSEYYFRNQFILWSYIHITVSFMLSDAHPMWIRRIYNPSLA